MKSVEEQFKVLMRGVDYGDDVTKQNMEEELLERLKDDRPLKVYLGVDPTSPDLHLGHIVPIQKLKQFQDLGHEITFLIGDFTGRVGDPSGQSKTRPMLTNEELKANAKTYTDQVFRILDESKTRVEFNSTWLSKMTFEDVIKLASNFTVAQFLERDYFRRRFDKGEPIHLQEFLYCLMQGYDAIKLETDVQIGGVDVPVPGALCPPPVRAHLDDHPAAAFGAEPRRLQTELGGQRDHLAVRLAGVDVVVAGTHHSRPVLVHSVALSALMGICRSASNSRSDSAGRPSVVR